jgi:hypothetical protein
MFRGDDAMIEGKGEGMDDAMIEGERKWRSAVKDLSPAT